MDDISDVATTLLARDAASRALGIELVQAGRGTAAVRMRVRPDMVNGHGVCHGGLIFTLADSAFAFACNGYDINTLAAAASIDFVSPAPLGATLTAVATEAHRHGRSGLYDVVVADAGGRLIARFHGRSHEIGGSVIDAARD
ncbi:MAG: hydroxyphenylacetyl-CoA thioesterase PaaI [Ilumatobacteraceae bacterium]